MSRKRGRLPCRRYHRSDDWPFCADKSDFLTPHWVLLPRPPTNSFDGSRFSARDGLRVLFGARGTSSSLGVIHSRLLLQSDVDVLRVEHATESTEAHRTGTSKKGELPWMGAMFCHDSL